MSRRFYDCTMSEKLLYTAFLLLVGLGYLMALVYLYTSHAGHDGKPGLSIEDIAENYYGNRSGSRLEEALRGPMARFINVDDRNEIILWLRNGAPQADYEPKIRPILAKKCLECHAPPTLVEEKMPNLSIWEGVQQVAQVDTGVAVHTLMKLSHIHLFGIGLVLLGVGLIFRLASLPGWLKYTFILTPFVAVFVDVLAWFLTKWDPHYAYTIVVAGTALGLALAAQILISLYQIWFLHPASSAGAEAPLKTQQVKACE